MSAPLLGDVDVLSAERLAAEGVAVIDARDHVRPGAGRDAPAEIDLPPGREAVLVLLAGSEADCRAVASQLPAWCAALRVSGPLPHPDARHGA